MKRAVFHRRGRVLASVTAVAGLVLTVSAVWLPPARSVAPVGDCATSFPVAELVPGAAVTGLTVTSGTSPEGFTGQVIGVLRDGIAPDIDMVMMRLSSSEIDRVGGIWQGMSGSPVYAADGRLIGAVAYGLSYGPSPVAGITPFEDMDAYLRAEAPAKVDVGDQAALRIARRTEVTPSQAGQGFSQLRMPLGVSGVGSRRLGQTRRSDRHPWLPKDTYAMGASAAPGVGAGPESVVAGGNLAASLSYGDITQAGVGTATSVCQGRVVGFGHPMAFLGTTSLTLHPAAALYIQEDSLGSPFKVANLGAPAGSITDDHLTGITGTLGPLPDTATVASTVAYHGRSRTGSSQVSVPDATADTTFFEMVGNHDRVLDGIFAGSELNAWTIRGSDGAGNGFALRFVDRYRSRSDIAERGGFVLADFVYTLTSLDGVSVHSIRADSTVIDSTATWKVSSIEQRRGGGWVTVSRMHPAVVAAGRTLKARVVLTGQGGTRTVRVSFAVPRSAARTRALLRFVGGGSIFTNTSFNSVAKARKVLRSTVRNDAVRAELTTTGVIGRSFLHRSARLGPTGRVVTGASRVGVRIR